MHISVSLPDGSVVMARAHAAEPVGLFKMRVGLKMGLVDPHAFALITHAHHRVLQSGSVAENGLATGARIMLALTPHSGRVRLCGCCV